MQNEVLVEKPEGWKSLMKAKHKREHDITDLNEKRKEGVGRLIGHGKLYSDGFL